MKIIAVANQKGGVGKTTTAVNLSACLAEQKKKTLVVDTDPQGNTTSGFGIDKDSVEYSIYDVLINDIPLKVKKLVRYIGNKPLYYDADGDESDEPVSGGRTLQHGDLAGYDWVDFTYPGELIKQAGESVTSILDSISNVLGNYEYFYDVNGNFVFQEKKNYLNTSYIPITELPNGSYSVNFGEDYIAYSFKGTPGFPK